MPKINFKKEYKKPPIVIFKYDNSKNYYLRFYVDKKYGRNGCYEKSLGKRWTRYYRKVRNITKLQVADFIGDYVLPVIFCLFTITYFSYCNIKTD